MEPSIHTSRPWILTGEYTFIPASPANTSASQLLSSPPSLFYSTSTPRVPPSFAVTTPSSDYACRNQYSADNDHGCSSALPPYDPGCSHRAGVSSYLGPGLRPKSSCERLRVPVVVFPALVLLYIHSSCTTLLRCHHSFLCLGLPMKPICCRQQT